MTMPDATAQAALVRSGEVSPEELVAQAISGIERLDPELNAVVIPLFEKARSEARTAPDGPFRGVPYLLKDLALVSNGDPSYHSIAGAKAAGYRADHDSYFVDRMRTAGFILTGKTNLDEMGACTARPRHSGLRSSSWPGTDTTCGRSGWGGRSRKPTSSPGVGAPRRPDRP